jgi:hypothetical protein
MRRRHLGLGSLAGIPGCHRRKVDWVETKSKQVRGRDYKESGTCADIQRRKLSIIMAIVTQDGEFCLE